MCRQVQHTVGENSSIRVAQMMMTDRYREHWRRPSTEQTWRKKNPKLSENLLNISQMKMLRRNKPGMMYRSMLGYRARGFEDFNRGFGDLNSDILNLQRVSGSWPSAERISRNKIQRMPDQSSNILRRTDNRSNVLKRPDHGMNILRSYHGPNMLRRTHHGSNMLGRSDHRSNFLRTSNELKRSGHNPNVQWRSATVHPTDVT